MLDLADIQRAAARLQGHLLHTPCVASRTLSDLTGAQVFLKFENLQFTASFKAVSYTHLTLPTSDLV